MNISEPFFICITVKLVSLADHMYCVSIHIQSSWPKAKYSNVSLADGMEV